MRTKHMTLSHPAAQQLLSYTTEGCLVKFGTNWTIEEMQAAITQVSHPSAKYLEASLACHPESLESVSEGCYRVIKWEDIKHDISPNLKISPIASIPHKSR